MAKTQPIKELEQIFALKNYFLERKEFRNYTLIVFGLNTSLRISDILQLRWADVFNFQTGMYRQHISIKEKKTGKSNIVAINSAIKDALELYCLQGAVVSPELFVFRSQKGENQHISRNYAFTIIKNAARELGFEDNISCHSLRKTFGYQAWKQGVQPALLMSIYNHSNYEITKRYLGITQDERDEVFMNITL
ncbi:MAG: tyrosine-type recombinase/integrase [Lachnospiraceae bacterium]|nr:tyrosine-type recombinase/integrase [Lachnospiraceae bacterium]MBP3595239.1 tyrosine-type recombinase/integrase [Lachnospiraceae bacterium]